MPLPAIFRIKNPKIFGAYGAELHTQKTIFLSQQHVPFHKKNMSVQNPVTYHLSKYGVCLPNGNNLDKDNVLQICSVFKNILAISNK